MVFNWDEFKGAYQNEQEARQDFTLLCGKLMAKNFPEFTVKNSDVIVENDNTVDASLSKKGKVYLSKYFLDGVSNSRKGQIRKSLNNNLPYMKANKITEWYLMMPLEFTPEELNWWENWSLRIKQENGITPIAILSDKIIELCAELPDHDIKGIEGIPRNIKTIEVQVPDNLPEAVSTILVDMAVESQAAPVISVDDKQDTDAAAPMLGSGFVVLDTDKAEQPKQEASETAASETATSEAADTAKPADDAESAKPASKKSTVAPEPAMSQLKLTWDFKQKFEALEAEKLALPTAKDNNQREVFDKRREASTVKNYLNDFVFGDMSKFKGKELLKKGQIYVTNKQYSRGLYIYEYANAKNLLDDPDMAKDYRKGVGEAKYKLTYKYYMINGDLLFAKRDYINASESYAKAMNTVADYKEGLGDNEADYLESTTYSSLIVSDEAECKYLESKAESLLQVGEFAKAIDNFQAALNLDPDNEQLKKRLELAQMLEKSNYFKSPWLSWLNIFIAPFYYYRARSIDPNIRELQKTDKLRNRAIWGLILMILIIAALVWFFLMGKRAVQSTSEYEPDTRTQVQASATPFQIQMSRGDYYMNRISPENPHYIDSAIYAYDRALRYSNTDTLAKIGYQKACIAKDNYLKMVQQNIDSDSASYFLSMRRPTEGLRLFKYKYDPTDPEKGKFGYVDENMIVKIAPVYDFNYKTMDGTGEVFYDGKAKVCLHVGNADTVYFWIDQFGKQIDNLDINGEPIAR